MFHYPVLGCWMGLGRCKVDANRLQTRPEALKWLQTGCWSDAFTAPSFPLVAIVVQT
jgi:hypothetical protein